VVLAVIALVFVTFGWHCKRHAYSCHYIAINWNTTRRN